MSYIAMGAEAVSAVTGETPTGSAITTGVVAGTTIGGLAPPPPPIVPPSTVVPPTAAPAASSPMTTYLVIGGIALAAFLVIKHIRKGKTEKHTTARATHPASPPPVASEG